MYVRIFLSLGNAALLVPIHAEINKHGCRTREGDWRGRDWGEGGIVEGGFQGIIFSSSLT